MIVQGDLRGDLKPANSISVMLWSYSFGHREHVHMKWRRDISGAIHCQPFLQESSCEHLKEWGRVPECSSERFDT